MLKADFEREVCAEAREYGGAKESPLDGLSFWTDLSRRRPDLQYGCGCSTCRRNDPWQHVKSILRGCGFSSDAT